VKVDTVTYANCRTTLFSLAVSSLLMACASNDRPTNTPGSDQLHALMTEELNLELVRLNTLSFDLHRNQTELDQLRARHSEAIADAAARLREGAASIHAQSPALNLPERDIQRFHELAQELERHAASLHGYARDGEVQEFDTPLREINNTCNACHSLYRGR